MVSLRQRLHYLPSLGGGIVVGLVLALIVWRSRGIEPALVIVVTALPFLLAALTGIAKTTTA
jgi:xanthosine utilization system XapX-like protein